jgi:cysteinyl-tRNA synthetase
MDDDLNTPQALATLFDLARDINRDAEAGQDVTDAQALLREFGGTVFGLTFEEHQTLVSDDNAARIDALVARRTELRAAKQFADADSVRDELAGMGVTLTDGADGTTWHLD